MRRYSFSIRGLMMVIVILALAFTGLRTPSRIWANVWFSLALTGITIAIPAAVATADERRTFWVGFAVCGLVYFILTHPGWTGRPVTSSSRRRSWTSLLRTSSTISI